MGLAEELAALVWDAELVEPVTYNGAAGEAIVNRGWELSDEHAGDWVMTIAGSANATFAEIRMKTGAVTRPVYRDAVVDQYGDTWHVMKWYREGALWVMLGMMNQRASVGR